jgi:leucyl aminopeptidase
MIARFDDEGESMAAKSRKNIWGLDGDSLLSRYLKVEREKSGKTAKVIVHMGKVARPPKEWASLFPQNDGAHKATIRSVETDSGARILVSPLAAPELEIEPGLKSSSRIRLRDAVGASLGIVEKSQAGEVEFDFRLPTDLLEEAILGLEIALYRFRRVFKKERPKPALRVLHNGKPVAEIALAAGLARGQAINLARHLTNLPPNLLNPVTYAEVMVNLFAGLKNVSVEVWDESRMVKEGMGLILAVGQGSKTPPRLVRIRYRPPGSLKPIALVGKGITFDTGGLDIKPSTGMRLMKKDMGGSAAVAGVAFWATMTQIRQPLDCYLPLAENSVDGRSFRPSDIVIARSGHSVEIHNTDAEGRLVLADAMDVAVTQSPKPSMLIDVATLTGAIKVALGSNLAGLFGNDTRLNASLVTACRQAGDFVWPMPLVQKYRSSLNSPFADFVNASDGFGGAITAALFLEKFARDVPWAHLDIYAWKDAPDGAWLESGGSGQMVAGLIEWLGGLPQGR